MNRNLAIRTIVAFIFGPLIIWIGYQGGYWLLGLTLVLASIGLVEYLLASGLKLTDPQFYISLLAVILMILCAAYYSYGLLVYILAGYFILIGAIYSLDTRPVEQIFRIQVWLFWGVAYLGMLYPFIILIRSSLTQNGGDWLLLLFGTLWLTDTLAMFGGKALGKRKLAPSISPNKTVAGFFSGLLGGVVVAVIMHFWRLPDTGFLVLLGATTIIAVIGQLGDLVESGWKRAVGIKDSSAIIPGHGGVLDRFDSLLFAAPLLYGYLFLMKLL